MSVKRKDFQKIATTIHQFLLKLTDTYECAELRDSLNLSLLQLQKYYRKCQQRIQHTGRYKIESNGSGYVSPRQCLRITLSRSRDETLSPMTPYIEEPLYFHINWTVLEERAELLRKSLSDENMNPQKSINTPPVHYAAMKADFDMLSELYIAKTDVLEDQDCIGRTPMIYAAYYNNIDVIRFLLDRGANPNSCDFNEVTALHWSCSQGHVSLVELLLDAGADKDYQDSFGRSATHWSCTTPNLETLQLLIEFGVNVNMHDRNGLTPSMWACRLDHLEHLKLLLSVDKQEIDHIDGYERDRNGRTIIHWSIRRQGPFECLKYLLNDDTARLKDDEGKTVLLLAAEQGALESCKIILETMGSRFLADIDDKDRTCLHLATVGGHGEVVNFLLENGMNLNDKDKTGATCMNIARNQYLFYCQLIISSHIREKERKPDSVASDGVDITHNIVSRHNSLSDSRNQTATPPRPPKSPKSTSSNSQNPKSPTLNRRLQNYDPNSDQNIDNPNGFDVMTSDPVYNMYNERKSLNGVLNGFDMKHLDLEQKTKEVIENVHNDPRKYLAGPTHEEVRSIDYLDNETGQQFHGSFNEINDQPSSLQNSINTHFEDSIPTISTRTLKRAQKINRISSANSDKDVELQVVTSPLHNEHDLKNERKLLAQSHKPVSPLMDLKSKINYGATLEPIRGELQLNPRRKKKRTNRLKGKESQSHDRFGNLNNHDQHEEARNVSLQSVSLENVFSKQVDLSNSVLNKRLFPSSIGANLEYPSRNIQTLNKVPNNIHPRHGEHSINDYQLRVDKRSLKQIQPVEALRSNTSRTSFPMF